VLRGLGPFLSRSPLEDVVSLQLFLLASMLPLLFLSAVIRERDRASLAVRKSEGALRGSYDRVRELAGKLIVAQEMERSRIARDMHDDLNQQLAALSLSISALRRRALDTPELHDLLREVQDRIIAVIGQVRGFAYDLHPGTLDHVALVAALRTHCADSAQHHGLDIRFTADDALAPLSRDVAVCLYRVLQEGLRNIANHAGVREARVSLTQTPELVELIIADHGRGFDPESGAARRGLGLLSIEERARLVGGTVTIASTRDGGTTIHLQVPAQAVPLTTA
jgi:signal transduction histidine kinase